MSADNWRPCPKCAKNKREIEEKLLNHIAAGNIPLGEFNALKAEYAEIIRKNKLDCSLREDYQLRIDDTGEFLVSYTAFCDICMFKFAYKHGEQVNLDKN